MCWDHWITAFAVAISLCPGILPVLIKVYSTATFHVAVQNPALCWCKIWRQTQCHWHICWLISKGSHLAGLLHNFRHCRQLNGVKLLSTRDHRFLLFMEIIDHPQNINELVLSFIPAGFIKMLCETKQTTFSRLASCFVYSLLQDSLERLSVCKLAWTESVAATAGHYGQLFCDREQSLPHVATSPNMMSSTRNGLKTDFDDNFRIIVLDKTSEFRMRNLVA